MKRTHRAISLCLLLALVLTAFGIFTSLAAGATAADEDVEYGNLLYDMDAITSKTISVSNGTAGPKVARDENGYWEMSYDGFDIKTAGSAGDYWLAQPSTSDIYINHKYTEKDGVKTITNAKNTDYFVIDFDISTNSSLLDGIYFHNRWYNNSGGNAQQNYIQLNGTDLDNFYISTNAGGSYIAPATTPGEWLNVTIVYDFSSVDENGYAKTGDWKAMVYFDGIYCGNLPGISTAAVKWYFNRVSTDGGAIQNGPDASTLFANFTYKTFPAGYEGVMTESGVLGYTGCTLMDIPELAYTQKNTPVKEDQLIATIQRGGESIEVYKYDELDASLKDGDVVILERSITTALLVDSGATVTFQDKNGTVLTPGTYKNGDLVYIEKIHTEDFSAGPVIRRFNQNPRNKNVTDPATTFAYAVQQSYAPVGESASARNYTYILTQDATYTNSATANLYSDTLDTDLNGYTLTLSNTKRFECSTDSKGGLCTLAFRNGNLIVAGGEITLTNTTSKVIFENINLSSTTGTNSFDQRGGLIYYKNVEGTTKVALTNAKASGVNRCAVIIDNSDITVTGTSAMSVSNVSSGGMRQGSMNVAVRILDSTVNVPNTGNLVSAATYGNSNGTYTTDAETGVTTFAASSAVQAKNDNNVKIIIDNSAVSAPTTALISANIADVLAIGKNQNSSNVRVDANEQFSFDLDLNITSSTVNAKYLAYQAGGAYAETLEYKDNYTFNVNINLENTDVFTAAATPTYVVRQSQFANTALNINIGANVSGPTNLDANFVTAEGSANTDNVNVVYTAEGQWIKRSLETAPAYSYATADKLDTHAYIYNGHEYEFTAYLGDPVNANNIPQELPAESSLLKYEWQYNIDGAWEAVVTYKGALHANVTAANDLALNVYLPANFGDEAYKSVYVEGYRADVTDVVYNGEAYKAITIHGIDPASATKDFTVKFVAVDENGAEAIVTREISVLDYIESALNSESVDAEGKQLVASLLNYIAKVAKYNNPTKALDAELLALLESEAYTSVALPAPAASEAVATIGQLGVFSAARIALDTKFVYELLVKDDFAGDVTVSYLAGGVIKTETFTVAGGDTVKVELLAYEVGTPITVTVGEASGELNLAGYLGLIAEPTAELTALAEAIAIYGAAAAAYMQ